MLFRTESEVSIGEACDLGHLCLNKWEGEPKGPGFGTRAEVGEYYFLMARQEAKPNETGETGWKTGCAEAEPTRGGMQPSMDGESQRGRLL